MLLRRVAVSCTVAAVFALSVGPTAAQSSPGGAVDPAITRLLAGIRTADKGQLAVSEEDGRFLRVLVGATNARQVLEIGAASGYSAIWIGMGLRQTGGKLTTIEFDPVRAKEAAANVQRAGLSDIVRVVHGDAFQEVPKVPGTFDLVFLDAWKPDYKKFFDMVYPRLNPGGVFVAHNVVNKKNEMEPFLRTILTHPSLYTTIVSPSGEGMSVSYRAR